VSKPPWTGKFLAANNGGEFLTVNNHQSKGDYAMNKTIYIGEDLGMGANKVWGPAGGLQVMSQVAVSAGGHLGGMTGLKAKRRPMEVRGSFGAFYVGQGAHEYGRPVENLDFDRLTGAPEMRALLYGTLAEYQAMHGAFKGPISLMVGLPLQMMTGEKAKEFQNGVKSWLRGVHEFEVDGTAQKMEVEQARLTSQPVGALFDYVLNDVGEIVAERGSALLDEVGVISVGFNTVELMVVKDQGAVERFTQGNTIGVRRLLELMNRDGAFSLGEMDERLRAGRMRSELKSALPIWGREVNGEIEKRWGQSYRRFAKVIVVGGGALILKDALTAQFGMKAFMPNLPVLSIARGLWKLANLKK
jgi:hypothetical protein